jgi:hypothetical protein
MRNKFSRWAMLLVALLFFGMAAIAQDATTPKSEVGRRQENQQDRIAQGVKSGKLTAGQTARLENREKATNRQVAADRAANGGKLTRGEKRQVNKEQNATSRRIYDDKH